MWLRITPARLHNRIPRIRRTLGPVVTRLRAFRAARLDPALFAVCFLLHRFLV